MILVKNLRFNELDQSQNFFMSCGLDSGLLPLPVISKNIISNNKKRFRILRLY